MNGTSKEVSMQIIHAVAEGKGRIQVIVNKNIPTDSPYLAIQL